MFPAAAEAQVTKLGALLEGYRTDRRRALLVTTLDATTTESGDLLVRVKSALIERFGVPASNIEVLRNAPKDAIVTAFSALAQTTQGVPSFFLFIGPGFDGAEIWLSTADGYCQGISDLSLSELRPLAQGAHMTAAFLITSSCAPLGRSGDTDGAAAQWRERPEIGVATLTAAPHMHRDVSDAASPPDVAQIVDVLALHGRASFSFGHWQAQFKGSHGLRLRGEPATEVLPYTATHEQALVLLRCLEQAPLQPMLRWLEQLTEQPDLAAEAWLQIAIIRALLGTPKEARAAVDEAIARRRADELDEAGRTQGATDIIWPEAHYHRGRILLALKQYSDAEAALGLAVEQEPAHARAHYHRAKAIRALIEADLEKLERASLRQYLMHGAPLGVDEDVVRG